MFPVALDARLGCVSLLWHSLGLPYNYFDKNLFSKLRKAMPFFRLQIRALNSFI